MNTLCQREVGCWGISRAVWFRGQSEVGGACLALLQRPYCCQKVVEGLKNCALLCHASSPGGAAASGQSCDGDRGPNLLVPACTRWQVLATPKLVDCSWGLQSALLPSVLCARADLTSDKDLYLDNSSVEEASGVYPIDDDDYSSGSGSGAEEDEDSAVITTSRTVPKLPTTSDVSRAETTTVKMQTKVPAQTKSPEEIDKEERPEVDTKKKSDEPGDDKDVFTQKHSENLFQRTEVLAAVIAGGVIGFLFAIFLILLLVYRMRKKDEGSYDLGERKPSCAAYQKAPTKEFYA
ncbi:unnamed protein product [Coccothraustes coccothraustes]